MEWCFLPRLTFAVFVTYFVCRVGASVAIAGVAKRAGAPLQLLPKRGRTEVWKDGEALPTGCPNAVVKLGAKTYTVHPRSWFNTSCNYVGVRGTTLQGTMRLGAPMAFSGDMSILGDISSLTNVTVNGTVDISGAINISDKAAEFVTVTLDGNTRVNVTGCCNPETLVGFCAVRFRGHARGTVSFMGTGGTSTERECVLDDEWSYLKVNELYTNSASLGFGHLYHRGIGFIMTGIGIFGHDVSVGSVKILFGIDQPEQYEVSLNGDNMWIGDFSFVVVTSFEGGGLDLSMHGANITVNHFYGTTGPYRVKSTGSAQLLGANFTTPSDYDSDDAWFSFVELSGNLTFVDARIGCCPNYSADWFHNINISGDASFIGSSIAAWDGAVSIEGRASFRDCAGRCITAWTNVDITGTVSFADCYSDTQGAAIWVGEDPHPDQIRGHADMERDGASVVLSGSVSFTNCSCKDSGGAIFLDSSCAACWSGASSVASPYVSIPGNATFADCFAGFAGGAIWSSAPINLSGHVIFRGCNALLGGAVCGFKSPIDLPGNVSFNRCVASGDGGAVFAYNNASVNVPHGASFSDCTAGGRAGAVFASGNVTMMGELSFVDCYAPNGAVLHVVAGNIFLSGSMSVAFTRSGEQQRGGTAIIFLSPASLAEIRTPVRFRAEHWSLRMMSVFHDVPFISADDVASVNLSSVVIEGSDRVLSAQRVADGVALSNLVLRSGCGPECVAFSQPRPRGLHPTSTLAKISVGCGPGTFLRASERNVTVEHSEVATRDDCTSNQSCCKISKTYGNQPSWWKNGKDTKQTCDINLANCSCQTNRCKTCLRREALDSYSLGCSSCTDGTVSLSYHPSTASDWREDWVQHDSSKQVCMDCAASLGQAAGDVRISCSGSSLALPRGVMVLAGFDHGTEGVVNLGAHHCPNALACPGGNISAGMAGVSVQVAGTSSMCNGNYAYSAGCTLCRYPTTGRQQWNGLVCEPCGWAYLEWAVFVLKPLAIFGLGLYAAEKLLTAGPPNTARMSELWNIALQFGTSCGLIFPLLTGSIEYADLHQLVRSALGLTAAVSTAPMYSSSTDCLYNTMFDLARPASEQTLLVMQLVVPALIGFSTLVATLWKRCRSSGGDEHVAFLARSMVVLGMMSLPNMTAALLFWVPCMGTSSARGARLFRIYAQSEECSTALTLLCPVMSVFFFVALGPVIWWRMIKHFRNSGLQRRMAYVGPLVARYRPEVDWWQIQTTARRTLLTCFVVLCPAGYASGQQLAGLSIMLFATCLLHLHVQPYGDRPEPSNGRVRGLSLNQIELVTHIASALLVLIVGAFISPAWGQAKAVSLTLVAVIIIIAGSTFCLMLYLIVPELMAEAPDMVNKLAAWCRRCCGSTRAMTNNLAASCRRCCGSTRAMANKLAASCRRWCCSWRCCGSTRATNTSLVAPHGDIQSGNP